MGTVAVITADVVNFTLLPTPAKEKKMVQALTAVLGNNRVEFYRGDSFQVYIRNPGDAFTLAIRLRTSARSFASMHDVRVSIGIGKVETPVRSLRTATGEAFVLSGRGFDQLTEQQRIIIQCNNPSANLAFRVIAYHADYIITRMTSRQAEVAGELLKGYTQAQAAKNLRKAQATVNQHTQAAGWTEIERLVTEYHNVLTQFNIV